MAKSTPRGGRAQPARAAAKSKKAAPEAESGEDKPGIGIDAGIAVVTTIVLLAALVVIDMMQGKNGDGIFFN